MMAIPYDAPVAVGRQLIALGPDVAAAILLTLEAGWAHASSFGELQSSAGEVVITERLRDGMRHVLKSSNFAWGKTMIVAPGTESRSRADLMVPDGRTDIPVYLIQVFLQLGEHDPHAIIECKRIAGADAHLCREYVVEGVDRFRTEKYAENHNIGFMTGYLLAGDAAAAVEGINAYLTRRTRDAEHLVRSEVIDESWVWSSRHSRPIRAEPIDLFHSFFELRPAPG
jgi:hypothetical protein